MSDPHQIVLPLSPHQVALMQRRFDVAAREAIVEYNARPEAVPEQAGLSVERRTIASKSPEAFDYNFWNGLPRTWLNNYFGIELASELLQMKMIKEADEGPAKQLAVPPLTDFDLQLAEAAGFNRAMNVWTRIQRFPHMQKETQEELNFQAANLAKLLAPWLREHPSSYPGKFKNLDAKDSLYSLNRPMDN